MRGESNENHLVNVWVRPGLLRVPCCEALGIIIYSGTSKLGDDLVLVDGVVVATWYASRVSCRSVNSAGQYFISSTVANSIAIKVEEYQPAEDGAGVSGPDIVDVEDRWKDQCLEISHGAGVCGRKGCGRCRGGRAVSVEVLGSHFAEANASIRTRSPVVYFSQLWEAVRRDSNTKHHLRRDIRWRWVECLLIVDQDGAISDNAEGITSCECSVDNDFSTRCGERRCGHIIKYHRRSEDWFDCFTKDKVEVV